MARVRVAEPRDYTIGRLLINRNEVALLVRDDQCVGFKFAGREEALSAAESRLAGFMQEGDTVVSRMLELKRVGLRRLLTNIAHGEHTWTLADGLDDAHVDHIIHRYQFYLSFL